MQLTIAKTLAILTIIFTTVLSQSAQPIQFKNDTEKGEWRVLIDNREAFTYQYGADIDLPHYWPLRSPSGKNMLIQQTQPYPHHRAFWFADKIRFDDEVAVFYNALYSGKDGKQKPFKVYRAPFHNQIRHVKFSKEEVKDNKATVEKSLVWMIGNDKPVLDEQRSLRIVALGNGEYFFDITFKVTAAYGDVEFISDAVHYAWPYLRMDSSFSVDKGGTITNSDGGVNQKGTHGKEARWVDYSNTLDGVTEGLTIFSHPSNPHPHKWLTRDYGTFGPRREDARSGKKFLLKKNQSTVQRVGILNSGHAKSTIDTRYEKGTWNSIRGASMIR